MKIWLIISNVLVALGGVSYVYTQMTNFNKLDLAAVILLVIGVVNTVLAATKK